MSESDSAAKLFSIINNNVMKDSNSERSVFYSSTFLEPFRGPRNSIFELSFETQSLEIALIE